MAQALTPYSQMPIAVALNGTEKICLSLPQDAPLPPFLTETCTVDQLAQFIGGSIVPVGSISMRQIFAALADLGVMYSPLFIALPASIADSYNIAWYHASIMTQTDPFITGFVAPTLGYGPVQIAALFALAATFPY